MKLISLQVSGPRTLATVEVTKAELEQMQKRELGLMTLIGVDAGGPDYSVLVTRDRGRVHRRQDYGPRYAAEMWETAEALRRALERCHDFMRRCYKHHGPTGKPKWILKAPGLWGKDSVREWQDKPCRACELERSENHDPGDEDRHAR